MSSVPRRRTNPQKTSSPSKAEASYLNPGTSEGQSSANVMSVVELPPTTGPGGAIAQSLSITTKKRVLFRGAVSRARETARLRRCRALG